MTSSTDHVQGLQKVRQIGDLIHNWEKIPSRKATLARARQWLQSEFYDQHGETVRTLRLKKGWSQTQLAEALGTSQSHIARIERGDQNLAIQTCRKLAAVLGVDMNTLDHALRVQEALAALKSAR